jgi:hypothetical protein
VTYPFGRANIPDFIYFIQHEMGVPVEALPVDSPDIRVAFALALDTVNPFIHQVSPNYYNLAVYNWGGDWLINWAADQMCSTFFADLRKKWNVTGFVAGVVASTSDDTTSMSLEVPASLGQLTLSDLQQLKTPYGRTYLSIAQKFGDIWGVS